MRTKTIDIQAKEWFDKVNGNSYFAGTITINYGTIKEETFLMPFQYGYGSQYEQEAKAILCQYNKIPADYLGLSSICRDNKIQLNTQIETDCLKRELKQIENQYNNNLKTI
ncbi:MAG: hypothetical protein QNK68_06180 [Flavobacteriales bacterium]